MGYYVVRVASHSHHAPARGAARRKRGGIETMPSGNLRVKVYAGVDALSGRRKHLVSGSDAVTVAPVAERVSHALQLDPAERDGVRHADGGSGQGRHSAHERLGIEVPAEAGQVGLVRAE